MACWIGGGSHPCVFESFFNERSQALVMWCSLLSHLQSDMNCLKEKSAASDVGFTQ